MVNRREFLKYISNLSLISSLGLVLPRKVLGQSLPRVIVIGAGISGAAAAQRLRANGFDVTVLEGRDRIGGRTWTDETIGSPVDLGASWIEGVNGNPLTSLTQQFGIDTYADILEYPIFQRNQRTIRARRFRRANRLYNSILEEAFDRGIAANIDRGFGFYINRVIREGRRNGDITRADLRIIRYLINANITGDIAANPQRVSTYFLDDDEGFSGDQHLFPRGYVQLASNLLRDIDLRLNQMVVQISYNADGGQVFTAEGQTFSADYIVVTLPLGVLKSGAVAFAPELPSNKLAAIERLDMGLLNKIVMRFPRAFWQDRFGPLSGFGNSRLGAANVREIGDFVDLAPMLGTPILMGIFGGDFAKQSEDLSDQELSDLAMLSLRKFFGADIPQPEQVVRTRWCADPFSLGAYSYLPVGARGSDRETLAEPVLNRLLFAGESTNRTYPATVHGAYLSGIREADRIIALTS